MVYEENKVRKWTLINADIFCKIAQGVWWRFPNTIAFNYIRTNKILEIWAPYHEKDVIRKHIINKLNFIKYEQEVNLKKIMSKNQNNEHEWNIQGFVDQDRSVMSGVSKVWLIHTIAEINFTVSLRRAQSLLEKDTIWFNMFEIVTSIYAQSWNVWTWRDNAKQIWKCWCIYSWTIRTATIVIWFIEWTRKGEDVSIFQNANVIIIFERNSILSNIATM